jgi:hypothetical protein
MEAGAIRPGYELWRPNREKAEAKSARTLVIFLLLVTAGIAFVITAGGWERLEGGKIFAIGYIVLYLLFAYLVARWNRGVLPVVSALAIILAIFAGIAAPAWFDRAKDGFDSPALPEEMLGLLTLLLVPVQVILIAVAMVAFNQDWHVEEERPIGEEVPPGDAPPEPAPIPARPGASRRAGTSGRGSRGSSRASPRRPKKA